MIDKTDETLSLWRSVPFSYAHGQDCLMSLADHVLRLTGYDYGVIWRGLYCNEAEALAHVELWGGPVRMIDESGLARTETPGRGDIVVVETTEGLIGGVHTGDSVAFRLERGMTEIRAKFVHIIASWKVL